MYRALETSFADLTRLYRYHQEGAYGAAFNLKGFDYPWLLQARSWRPGERILDVGAAYSDLPQHMHDACGCETWVADDFGTQSNDPYWLRNRSPQEHIAAHPNIHYVLERLGDPAHSSLPAGTFDVVYSISTLEHVPTAIIQDIWRHMDLLLKPGGEMLHAVDFLFPSNQGLRKILLGAVFDAFYGLTTPSQRLHHYMATPRAYVRLMMQTLGTPYRPGKTLPVVDMCLDPDVLTESFESGLNRIRKDGMADFRYQRVGTLLIHLKKAA